MGIKSYAPQALGVALLTYIPSTEAYFAEALNIVKVQIASLAQNTEVPYDLLIFDNGSCEEAQKVFTRMLSDRKITWLFLSSKNLGKTGALNWILNSMPNNWICYADSDMLFRKGWYSKSMELFSTFPDVGVVSAQPSFFENLEGPSLAMQSIQSKGYSIHGKIAPTEHIDEYVNAYGLGEDLRKSCLSKKIPCLQDLDGNDRAYIGACHMQFLGRRSQLQQILPLPATLALSTNEDRQFDTRIDQKNWLRLSTTEFYVVHMGNHLEDAVKKELAGIIEANPTSLKSNTVKNYKKSFAWKILFSLNQVGFIRKLFKQVYINLFEFYSNEKK